MLETRFPLAFVIIIIGSVFTVALLLVVVPFSFILFSKSKNLGAFSVPLIVRPFSLISLAVMIIINSVPHLLLVQPLSFVRIPVFVGNTRQFNLIWRVKRKCYEILLFLDNVIQPLYFVILVVYVCLRMRLALEILLGDDVVLRLMGFGFEVLFLLFNFHFRYIFVFFFNCDQDFQFEILVFVTWLFRFL